MGPLTLPTGGSVYVDANAIIYSVERIEPPPRPITPPSAVVTTDAREFSDSL